jgi:cytolethal distending toxin subunit A
MQNTRTYTAVYSTTQHAYKIVNGHSSKCLSPAAGSTGLNVAIVQFTCDNDKSRYWTVVKRSGSWTLANLKSGLCLSPAGGGTGLNTVIVQYTCDGNPARNWYVFTPRTVVDEIGDGYCATIAGASKTPNAVAVTYDCHSDTDAAILWDMVATSTPNNVMIRNVGSGLCLSPAGGATAAGTLVVQYYCDGQPSRLWQVGDNPYDLNRIVNTNSGLCLAGNGGGLNNALVIAACDDQLTSWWFVFTAF